MNMNGKPCEQCGEIGHTKRYGCFEDKAKFKAFFAEAETKKEACLSLRCGNVSSTGKQCNKVFFNSFANKAQHQFRPNSQELYHASMLKMAIMCLLGCT